MNEKLHLNLIEEIDAIAVRYFLHQTQNLESVDVEKLGKASKLPKKCSRTLKLSEEEQKIIKKAGKLTGHLVNYVILTERENQGVDYGCSQ